MAYNKQGEHLSNRCVRRKLYRCAKYCVVSEHLVCVTCASDSEWTSYIAKQLTPNREPPAEPRLTI